MFVISDRSICSTKESSGVGHRNKQAVTECSYYGSFLKDIEIVSNVCVLIKPARLCARYNDTPVVVLVSQALAMLTAAASLSGPPADEMVENCTVIMREYRQTFEEIVKGGRKDTPDSNGNPIAQGKGEKTIAMPVEGKEDMDARGQKLDIFSMLRLVFHAQSARAIACHKRCKQGEGWSERV